MLPDNDFVFGAMPSPFMGGRALTMSLTHDYESGPIAPQDPSEGLFAQTWQCYVLPSSPTDIRVSAENQPEIILLSTTHAVTEVSHTFDQNGRINVAYVTEDDAYLFWYDPLAASMVSTKLPSNVINPRVSLDDKRNFATNSGMNDIILMYINTSTDSLCYRLQRDRYTIEYVWQRFLNYKQGLFKIGMNEDLRFQAMWR